MVLAPESKSRKQETGRREELGSCLDGLRWLLKTRAGMAASVDFEMQMSNTDVQRGLSRVSVRAREKELGAVVGRVDEEARRMGSDPVRAG